MNTEQARNNMLSQQLRTWDVLDQRVLDHIAQTPREEFVPSAYKNLAFADINIPIGHDEIMWTPKEEGRVLQALKIKPTDKILEIGTGSAYLTALLSQLGTHVDSIEIFPEFTQEAQNKLSRFNINNVKLLTADAVQGWQNYYDVIVISGSLPFLPASFRKSLNPNGRLFAIIGQAPAMEATLITHLPPDIWREEKLFETVIPVLRNAQQPELFIF